MRWLISFVLVAVTVVLQLTVVDRIAFPGGAGPNLVLLAVVALALAGGPLAGVLTGFLAGLALDVAPPGSHFVGQDALVFCLIGYACGLLADDSSGDIEQGHTALFEIMVTAAGVICGEALAALLGVMLSDPRVTWPAITHVLPVAVAYDVLLCPFVLYAVAAALRLAGARGEERRVGWSASQARTPVPGSNQGAIRQLAAGNGPRLRLSERDRGTGSIGGLRGPGAGRPTGRREPQLKLGRAGQRTSAGLGGAFAPAALGAGAARVRFGGRRRRVCPAARCSAARSSGGPAPARPGAARPGWAAPGSAARAWAGPCSAARCSAGPPPRRSGTGATWSARRVAGWPGALPGSPGAARSPGSPVPCAVRADRSRRAGAGCAARPRVAAHWAAAASAAAGWAAAQRA